MEGEHDESYCDRDDPNCGYDDEDWMDEMDCEEGDAMCDALM